MSQLQVSHRARTLLDWNRSEAATKETLCCSVHMIITLSSLQGDGNYFSTVVLIPQLVLNSQQQSQKCLYLGVNISDSQRNLLICCFASSQWKCRSASREQCWVEVAITRIRGVDAGLTCSYMCSNTLSSDKSYPAAKASSWVTPGTLSSWAPNSGTRFHSGSEISSLSVSQKEFSLWNIVENNIFQILEQHCLSFGF